jgi:hypothetical protein
LRTTLRSVVAGSVAVAAALAMTGTSLAAVSSEKVWEDDTLLRPAFSASGDIVADDRPELVVTDYGFYQSSPLIMSPGSMHIFRLGKDLGDWQKITIFDESEDILFPSQPTIADVDGDGDADVINGGGFFWDSDAGLSRGTLTWWENDDPTHGTSWIRHTIVEDSPWAYHNLQYVDLDDDGIKDIVTVGEQGHTKPTYLDDQTELQFYKGLGGGEFADSVALADRGGSSPVVHDVDGDGDLDVVSAQYFHVNQVVVGGGYLSGDATFVWFENTSDGVDPLSSADFTKHEIARCVPGEIECDPTGPGYGIYPIADLFGDGVTRYVGVNHSNTTPGTPGAPPHLLADPNAFIMTPGSDPTDPWDIEYLADSYDEGAQWAGEPRSGQAAPGKLVRADFDADGDIDLVISGDGDFRAMLVEQTAPGTFHQRVLPGSEGFGQAGATVADFDVDGQLELTLSSFENKTVGMWSLGAVPVEEPPVEEPVDGPKDTTAPTVKLDVPGKKAAKKAESWKKIKGTVKDTGTAASGPEDVRAKLVVKTTTGQWKYLDGKKWKNAKSKKKAFAKADVRKDASVSGGTWSMKAKAPAQGRLSVRYWANDEAGNTSEKKTHTQKITK